MVTGRIPYSNKRPRKKSNHGSVFMYEACTEECGVDRIGFIPLLVQNLASTPKFERS
jgi:hypothetical protein